MFVKHLQCPRGCAERCPTAHPVQPLVRGSGRQECPALRNTALHPQSLAITEDGEIPTHPHRSGSGHFCTKARAPQGGNASS